LASFRQRQNLRSLDHVGVASGPSPREHGSRIWSWVALTRHWSSAARRIFPNNEQSPLGRSLLANPRLSCLVQRGRKPKRGIRSCTFGCSQSDPKNPFGRILPAHHGGNYYRSQEITASIGSWSFDARQAWVPWDGKCVARISAWRRGRSEGAPIILLRGALIYYALPPLNANVADVPCGQPPRRKAEPRRGFAAWPWRWGTGGLSRCKKRKQAILLLVAGSTRAVARFRRPPKPRHRRALKR